MDARSRVYTLPQFADLETPAPVTLIDPKPLPARIVRSHLALVAVAAMAGDLSLLAPEALYAAVELEPEKNREEAAEAIRLGLERGAI